MALVLSHPLIGSSQACVPSSFPLVKSCDPSKHKGVLGVHFRCNTKAMQFKPYAIKQWHKMTRSTRSLNPSRPGIFHSRGVVRKPWSLNFMILILYVKQIQAEISAKIRPGLPLCRSFQCNNLIRCVKTVLSNIHYFRCVNGHNVQWDHCHSECKVLWLD